MGGPNWWRSSGNDVVAGRPRRKLATQPFDYVASALTRKDRRRRMRRRSLISSIDTSENALR
jgi:hypothetical protein